MRRRRISSGALRQPLLTGTIDVSPFVKRAEMGGSLNPGELLKVASLLRVVRGVKQYMENRKEEKTSIDSFFSALSGNKYLESKITESIISEEEIADSASSELYDIRRQMRTASSKIRDTLNRTVTSSHTPKCFRTAS